MQTRSMRKRKADYQENPYFKRPRRDAQKGPQNLPIATRLAMTSRYRASGKVRQAGELPYFNHDEKLFLEAATNPFGHQAGGGYTPPRGAKVLDCHNHNSLAITCMVQGSWTTDAASTHVHFRMTLPTGLGTSFCLQICDNDTGVGGGASFNAQQAPVPGEWAQVYNMWHSWRLVGAGLKVKAISSMDDTAGLCYGDLSTFIPATSVPAYDTIANAESYVAQGAPYDIMDGITVRWMPIDSNDYDFTTHGTGSGDPRDNAYRVPQVLVSGFKAGNTVLSYAAVWHLELMLLSSNNILGTQSPVSLKWYYLTAIANDTTLAPYVTRGDSFKSLIMRGGKALFEAFKKYYPEKYQALRVLLGR